jgi:hypothetical protein
MRHLSLIAALPLAACGGVSSDTTNDPVAQNVIEATAQGTPAAIAAATDCGNRPDFVPVYEGAQITTCVSGADGIPRHVSGNIVYLTHAAPAEVLGWSRAQANASGLVPGPSTPTSYSAGEKTERNVRISVEPMNGGTRVTLNWGRGV